MGLTIHYKLKAKGTEAEARKIVEQLHQAAQDLPFKELGDIIVLAGNDCVFDRKNRHDPKNWLICQAQGSLQLKNTHDMGGGEMGDSYLKVTPTHIIAFNAWPGEGCEESNFGLCQYPATIEHNGKRIRTKMAGWRWRSFCKTQYASDPACGGIENFLRCHLLVVALLDKAKELGCLDEVHDEGKFWESRDVKALVPEIESWNGMIAAFAGQLKDTLGEGIEAPITEFPNFERLELAGQKQLTPHMQELAKLIKKVIKKN